MDVLPALNEILKNYLQLLKKQNLNINLFMSATKVEYQLK